MRTSRTNRGTARPKLAYSPVARSPRISLHGELPLREHAERALTDYFASLNGHHPARLYELVMREVEEPLFRTVLEHAGGNQSRAAIILGITRATLRKKLREFGLSA